MKVIIDRDIPYINGILEKFSCDAEYLKGTDFTASGIRDADALIIRTRTKCTEALLKGSKVKFIASATIGEDHIDMDFCKKAGITVYIAKGCNSYGVMQYVFTALSALYIKNGYGYANKTLGVIGAGNVGSKVAAAGEMIGMKVLRCDPPLADAAGKSDCREYFSLDETLREADIVSLHVPLTHDGKYPTFRLAGNGFFRKIKEGAVLINSSRGEVIDDTALLEERSRLSHVILDVWNNEPFISRDVLDASDIATPHIAGYSKQGKINGTNMAINAFGKFFNIQGLASANLYDHMEAEPETISIMPGDPSFIGKFSKENLSVFPIMELDRALREDMGRFEELRSGYRYRNETRYALQQGRKS